MNRTLFRTIACLSALVLGSSDIQDGRAQGSLSIVTFRASPARIARGGSSTLTWKVTGAITVTLDAGANSSSPLPGNLPAEGQVAVNPAETTIYVLQAEGSGANSSASATVHVGDQ